MKTGKIENYITRKLMQRPLHFSLLDPDPKKASMQEIAEFSKNLAKLGTDAMLVGGSTGVKERALDRSIETIKKYCRCPVILYPGNANGVSKKADAVFFMSLMNSRDPLWITGMQARASAVVKRFGIEPLPMAYIIVEPGMKAGRVGNADLIKNNDRTTAVNYALAAQYLGMRFVYLEAGSGSHSPVQPSMVRSVKRNTDINLIVGGGIRTASSAKAVLNAGADIIVTGTVIEDSMKSAKEIIETVRNFKRKNQI